MDRCIDVSSYQGNIDWNKVKESGIQKAVLKIIRKDLNKDKSFEVNYKNCMAARVEVVGVYNYSYATTIEKAIVDAQAVIKHLSGRKLKVWLDVEDNVQKGLGYHLVELIKAYRSTIEAAGLEFGVYTGLSFYSTYIKPYKLNLSNYWIARYGINDGQANMKNLPIIDKPIYAWQYTSKGVVPGISGNVDVNLILNNVDKSAAEILRLGSKGSTVIDLQKKLAAKGFTCGKIDGIFGRVTLSAVKEFQISEDITTDGIVGPVTWSRLR